MDISLQDGSIVVYTARALYRKVMLMDCTLFLSEELSFGAEL